MLKKLKYRADIDGLRALAILSVIIFHINPNYLPNGFLGVDIFFVISGYLITYIIYREICLDTFSFKNFYTKRIKRILPVFFVVLLTGLLFTGYLFVPYDQYGVANSAIASIFFLANIYFGRVGTGYFDNKTEELPFTHIWSLSVEEQFYFIFPIILILLLKIKVSDKAKIILLILLGLSLLLTSFINLKSLGLEIESYYLSHLRMPEMMVGSILAIYSLKNKNRLTQKKSNYLAIFSLILILISFFLKNFFTSPYFPGIFSLIPCVGIALLILANENGGG